MELWIILITLLIAVAEVFADYCGDRIFCDAPFKCCETKIDCCYDSMLQNHRHLRLQIWNMWYFWFLIIFMIMSCFGGCGYYRRRRLAMLTGSSNSSHLTSTAVLEPVHRGYRTRNNEGSARQFNFFAYIGPGVRVPEPVSNLPPAYSEVVSHPSHFPFSKVELPPYPGDDKPEDGQFALSSQESAALSRSDTAQPPPYSEYYPVSPQPPAPPLQCVMSSQNAPLEERVAPNPPETSAREASSTTFSGTH